MLVCMVHTAMRRLDSLHCRPAAHAIYHPITLAPPVDIYEYLIQAWAYTNAGPKPARSMWLAEDAGKRWTEVFFLAYSPFWMLWALCILVPFRLYEVSNLSLNACNT